MEDMLLLVAATDPAERDSLLHKLLHATASLEAMLDKPTHAVAMNAREKLGYEKQLVEMGRKIEQSELAVATAKERLGNARAKRRRQEEYDSLAAVALKEPSRAESTAAIAATEADLERLRTDLVALETKVRCCWHVTRAPMHATKAPMHTTMFVLCLGVSLRLPLSILD